MTGFPQLWNLIKRIERICGEVIEPREGLNLIKRIERFIVMPLCQNYLEMNLIKRIERNHKVFKGMEKEAV